MRPSQNGSSFLFAANINPATFRCCFIKRQAQNFQSPQTWASLDLTFRFGAVSHLASLWGFAFKSSCQSLSPKLRNPSCAILTLRAGDLDSGQHLNGLFINLVPSKEKRHLKKSWISTWVKKNRKLSNRFVIFTSKMFLLFVWQCFTFDGSPRALTSVFGWYGAKTGLAGGWDRTNADLGQLIASTKLDLNQSWKLGKPSHYRFEMFFSVCLFLPSFYQLKTKVGLVLAAKYDDQHFLRWVRGKVVYKLFLSKLSRVTTNLKPNGHFCEREFDFEGALQHPCWLPCKDTEPCNRPVQMMEHTVVNGSVHKQHQRAFTQICVQFCLRALCERAWSFQSTSATCCRQRPPSVRCRSSELVLEPTESSTPTIHPGFVYDSHENTNIYESLLHPLADLSETNTKQNSFKLTEFWIKQSKKRDPLVWDMCLFCLSCYRSWRRTTPVESWVTTRRAP